MGRRQTLVAQTIGAENTDQLAQPEPAQADALTPLLRERAVRLHVRALPGLVLGRLVALTDAGATPLVLCPTDLGMAAVSARTLVDLRAEHIGMQVSLSFENGNPSLPIVTGVLRDGRHAGMAAAPRQLVVDADGERVVVTARKQLVLRCGEASITMTSAGKVLIEGRYVSSRSTGMNRIKGGSIQLN